MVAEGLNMVGEGLQVLVQWLEMVAELGGLMGAGLEMVRGRGAGVYSAVCSGRCPAEGGRP
jgi:hypothetical protein